MALMFLDLFLNLGFNELQRTCRFKHYYRKELLPCEIGRHRQVISGNYHFQGKSAGSDANNAVSTEATIIFDVHMCRLEGHYCSLTTIDTVLKTASFFLETRSFVLDTTGTANLQMASFWQQQVSLGRGTRSACLGVIGTAFKIASTFVGTKNFVKITSVQPSHHRCRFGSSIYNFEDRSVGLDVIRLTTIEASATCYSCYTPIEMGR